MRSFEQSETDKIDEVVNTAKRDEVIIDIKAKLQKVEKENVNLKQRNTDVERDLGLLKIESEEIEIRNHELLNKNTDLHDKIEELYKEISSLRENASNKRLVKLENENKILNGKLRNAEESEVESIDIIEILENTLKNHEHDVERLNGEIMDLKNENQIVRLRIELKMFGL